MKIQQRIIYHCDFCNKYRLVKSAMEKHEPFCPNNPVNQHLCFKCIYLSVKTVEVYEYDDEGQKIGIEGEEKRFECKELGLDMYSYKAEQLGLLKKYPNDFENKIRMPLECDDFSATYPDPLDECREQEISSALAGGIKWTNKNTSK